MKRRRRRARSVSSTSCILGAVFLVSTWGLATEAAAQVLEPARHEIRVTPFGEVLDFHPDGGWRPRARLVAAERARLRRAGDFVGLNAALRGAAPSVAVAGRLTVPAILFRFADRGVGAARAPAELADVLFGAAPPAGRPYTVRTFYEELSSGLVSVQGETLGWYALPGAEATYTGPAGTCTGNPFGSGHCNGIFSGAAFLALNAGLRRLITLADFETDFGQFDNDGPDGVPNSGDDDGIVDAVLFIHSELDGACGGAGNNHIWAHKSSSLAALESNDPSNAPGGGFVQFRDYTIQSAVGGASGCDSAAVMPIGTTAHETGHAFGLPDLYDVSGSTQGIGRWGLMGSGNWSTQLSPSRMSAWSLDQLGWITVHPLTRSQSVTLGPVSAADTVFYLDVLGDNPRAEYFLIENRQAAYADTAVVRHACEVSGVPYPTACGGGLAIWHIDGQVIARGGPVNAGGFPHGVALVQADGRGDLRSRSTGNAADAGDLYPGVTGNTTLGPRSIPPAGDNSFFDRFVGFSIDSIRTVGPSGAMAFRVRIGGGTVVRATDTLATVLVDDVRYNRFFDVVDAGVALSVAIDSFQTAADGRSQFVFERWSNGGAREHSVTIPPGGDSIVADLSRTFLVRVALPAGGTVVSRALPDPNQGSFIAFGATIELIAHPAPGMALNRWGGDTTATGDTLRLAVTRPFDIQAEFVTRLEAVGGTLPDARIAADYAHRFIAAGGVGGYTWRVVGGGLPEGLVLLRDGRLVGQPLAAGDFTAILSVRSGTQLREVEAHLHVSAPQLTVTGVLAHLVGTAPALDDESLRYLDLLGNRNGRFDVGDFLAWVQETGATVSTDELGRVFVGDAR